MHNELGMTVSGLMVGCLIILDENRNKVDHITEKSDNCWKKIQSVSINVSKPDVNALK